MRRFTVDRSVRRVGGGRVVVGGSPLKLFRLTDAGGRLLDTIARGDPVASAPAVDGLIDRLLDAGVLHPLVDPDAASTADAGLITIVIPAHNAGPSDLARLVASCRDTSGNAHIEVIIVDDASTPPLADVAGATMIRRTVNGGPAAARSTGFANVTTPFVAFVDTDVELSPHWLRPLLAHFDDARVALVAPRVASTPGDSLIERYEMSDSPLDLGPEPARVRAGTRVSYVPAAVVVCRVDALRDVGGFDETLRVGEDVDLVWRLDEAGWRVRYEPSTIVTHHPRESLGAWMRQRRDYGTSAAPLAGRHRGALAPVRVSGWSAASWLAVAAGWPIVGGLIAGVTTALLVRKLRDVPDGKQEAIRLAGLGHLFAGRSLASAVSRAWWPLAALAALVSKRARRVVLVATIAPAAIDWLTKRPAVDPVRYIALRILDDMSYGAGLAHGVIRSRTLDPLLPDLTTWPHQRTHVATNTHTAPQL